MSQLNVAVLEEMMRKLEAHKPAPLPGMLIMNRKTWLEWARSGLFKVAYRPYYANRRFRFLLIDNHSIPVAVRKDAPEGQAYGITQQSGISKPWKPFG